MLDLQFTEWEEEADQAVVLDPEDLDAVALGDVPNAGFREETLRGDFGASVEDIGEDPVEYFNEEREFL